MDWAREEAARCFVKLPGRSSVIVKTGAGLIAIAKNYVRLVPNASAATLVLLTRRSRESGNPGKIAGFLLPQE
jgi:hypothetical protein